MSVESYLGHAVSDSSLILFCEDLLFGDRGSVRATNQQPIGAGASIVIPSCPGDRIF